MEPRNDRTWLLVGVGVGCFFVLLSTLCLGSIGCYACSRETTSSAPPYVPPDPPDYPPPPTTDVLPPPSLPPPPSSTTVEDHPPITVHATITEVSGSPGVTVGQTCEFNVERRDRDDGSGFWCNAQVVCGGHLLYGGPMAGFFPCTLFDSPTRGVVGSDPNTTSVDQDAAFSIDTSQLTMELHDDASGPNGELHVAAHIDTIE